MKTKTHYVLVKASFKQPVTGAFALHAIRDLAALSYEEHSADDEDGNEIAFKLKATKTVRDPKGGRQ